MDAPRRRSDRLGSVLDRLAALEARHRGQGFATLRTAVLAGDADGWLRFVERYSRFVYTVALKLTDGVGDRDEVAAQIYARVFERLAARDHRLLRRFRGRCRFTSYLFRMVQSERNETLDRRRTAAPVLGDRAPQAVPASPLLRPDRLLRAVGRALARLDATDRLVLRLRFGDGAKLREIADGMGFANVNAAAYAVRRAIGRLALLRELRESERLGEPEIAAARELIGSALIDGRADDQHGEPIDG